MKKKIEFDYEVFSNLKELPEEDQLLIEKAFHAIETAYAPYSQFHVGAAVLLANGQIVIGSNQENVAYPSGLCAERVALFSASAQFSGIEIKKMAIAAKSLTFEFLKPVTPCGACRQVMSEFENHQPGSITLLMAGQNKEVYKVEGVNSLLPLLFFEKGLKK